MGMLSRRQDLKTVTPDDVKVCALCDTLNYQENGECFLCGWRGAFRREPMTVEMAWLRLQDQFEGVRREHVTARQEVTVGELGVVEKTGRWHQWQGVCVRCWQAFLASRDARAAAREQSLLRRRFASPFQEQGG